VSDGIDGRGTLYRRGDDINGRSSISSLEEEIRIAEEEKFCTHKLTHTKPSWPPALITVSADADRAA
jgi:hypothetical protein